MEAKTVGEYRLLPWLIRTTFRAEMPLLRLFGGNANATLRTHHVRPYSKAAQRPRWRAKPSQYLNLVYIYPHLLLRFPQRGVQHRFIGRVNLPTWKT